MASKPGITKDEQVKFFHACRNGKLDVAKDFVSTHAHDDDPLIMHVIRKGFYLATIGHQQGVLSVLRTCEYDFELDLLRDVFCAKKRICDQS